MRTELLGWLDEPRTDAGIAFADEAGHWVQHTYAELASQTARISTVITEFGGRPGDVVSIILPTGLDFPAAFFGALYLGAIPNPLAPPPTVRSMAPEAYAEHAGALLREAAPAVVLTCAEHCSVVERAVSVAGIGSPIALADVSSAADGWAPSRRGQDDFALLQFTSGSMGQPRGIAVSSANLEANIKAIGDLLRMDPASGTASWLPLYHDMGLVGTLLTPIVNASQLWLMRPEQFLRRPMLFLERMSGGIAKVTAAPAFGYGHIALRIGAQDLVGLDFTEWRAAIVGAERIDPVVLRHVVELLSPHGFRKEAFLPAYGLAEATLIVSGCGLDAAPRAVRVDWTELSAGTSVRVVEETHAGDLPAERGMEWIVGCGTPMPGTAVDIVDDSRKPVPEGTVGEIAVRGASVARELYGTPSARSQSDESVLYTGDAGFIYDGELFVIGRMGSSIKVRGRNIFVEELEARLAEVPGIPLGRIAIIAGVDHGVPCLLVVGESAHADWADDAAAALRAVVGSSVGIRIMHGPRGSILRTTSGKPRRRRMWERLTGPDAGESKRLTTALLSLPGVRG